MKKGGMMSLGELDASLFPLPLSTAPLHLHHPQYHVPGASLNELLLYLSPPPPPQVGKKT